MSEYEEIREWLLETVKLMVDFPSEVMVEALPGDQRTILRVKVNPRDRGKVIGRQGRTAQSVRVLTGAMGMKVGWRFIFEIEEKAG